MRCPSNHWNNGNDVCADCGEDLNPPMTAHEEMLARVRVSDRFWSESDLYFRTNRWSAEG